jgi:hypothetical protein
MNIVDAPKKLIIFEYGTLTFKVSIKSDIAKMITVIVF